MKTKRVDSRKFIFLLLLGLLLRNTSLAADEFVQCDQPSSPLSPLALPDMRYFPTASGTMLFEFTVGKDGRPVPSTQNVVETTVTRGARRFYNMVRKLDFGPQPSPVSGVRVRFCFEDYIEGQTKTIDTARVLQVEEEAAVRNERDQCLRETKARRSRREREQRYEAIAACHIQALKRLKNISWTDPTLARRGLWVTTEALRTGLRQASGFDRGAKKDAVLERYAQLEVLLNEFWKDNRRTILRAIETSATDKSVQRYSLQDGVHFYFPFDSVVSDPLKELRHRSMHISSMCTLGTVNRSCEVSFLNPELIETHRFTVIGGTAFQRPGQWNESLLEAVRTLGDGTTVNFHFAQLPNLMAGDKDLITITREKQWRADIEPLYFYFGHHYARRCLKQGGAIKTLVVSAEQQSQSSALAPVKTTKKEFRYPIDSELYEYAVVAHRKYVDYIAISFFEEEAANNEINALLDLGCSAPPVQNTRAVLLQLQ